VRRRIRIPLSVALAGALTVAASASASAAADPDLLYVAVVTPDGDGPGISSYGTASPTTGELSALPTSYTTTDPNAIEIVGDLGYAIVPQWEDAEFTTQLATWDPATGAVLSSRAITIDEHSLAFAPGWSVASAAFHGLDSPDGASLQTVLCIYVDYPDDTGDEGCFLGALDPATALFTATADLSALRSAVSTSPDEIATDPGSGATAVVDHRFDPDTFDYLPYVATVTSGVMSAPVLMAGVRDAVGAGMPQGADYGPDGTLWLSYRVSASGDLLLLSFGPGSALDTATPTVVGPLTSSDPDGPRVGFAATSLAAASWTTTELDDESGSDPGSDTPALADTGASPMVGAAFAAVVLLLAGSLLLAARRHRTS
jgi:hypothetical protein